MTTINILELVSVCLDLAEQSGEIIRKVYQSGALDIKYKDVDDPVTIADITVQKHIVAGLRSRWPAIRIVGEEELQEGDRPNPLPSIDRISQFNDRLDTVVNKGVVPLSDVIVFIDPLDATREFTKGNVNCVMTLIGVSVNGVAHAGVIHQPFVDENGDRTTEPAQWRGRTVWGIVGLPVCGVRNRRAPEDEGKVIAVTTASHYDDNVDRAIKLLAPDKVVRAGGAGYKTLMIIERLADVYVFPTVGSKLWDICAPHAILTACGGTLTEPSGKPITYTDHLDQVMNKQGIVITMGDHQRYIQLLNKQ
ncbi:hypothetical protein SAMD00019534_030840 [Acytostelium subglobosum LB1]|uniref:hypothetical protein n=1 Tax=Acytostelium subglobosum LB1 TaxID=1410327 RepID=UPI000644A1FC|nr:hypothetical protein SAMD00019534_030840 [Acytostelium subglobosum LB1]GAM19909.1 hypothetical protein SAMD00019534_030840 [Acytostelium subglobosum LB1]|eukprot:XP_012756671.1 hypothetical protein SAMD00019534_030840 [Acytostelium subglobosum LB1]